MRKITAAAVQMSVPETRELSIEKAEKLVRKAALEGANVILLPELFETKYGGNIEYIQTTWDNRFNDLSTLVVGGTSPDIFPGQEGDVYPERVINGMFEA